MRGGECNEVDVKGKHKHRNHGMFKRIPVGWPEGSFAMINDCPSGMDCRA